MRKMLLGAIIMVSPMTLNAQEREDPSSVERHPLLGKVYVSGEWRVPTFDEIRRGLGESRGDGEAREWAEPAVALLRQTHGHTAREVQAMTDELVRFILEGTQEEASLAAVILTTAAAADYPGLPYDGAVDALIFAYKTLDARSDAHAEVALGDVFRANARGVGYVRRMFESHEPPPPCQLAGRGRTIVVDSGPPIPPPVIDNPCPNVSKWCDAGRLLLDAEGGPPDREEFSRLCEWGRTIRS